jgi:mono/diheme cytochrome c family protein
MKKVAAFFITAAVVLLAAYQALIYYDNNFRYGRMRETPGVKPHEEPLLKMEAGLVPVSGGDGVLMAQEPASIRPPFEMEAEATIARGRLVYFSFCAQCHGNNFDGRGTVGQSFNPLPTDLRDERIRRKPASELFKTISYGVAGGRQPALHTTITIDDRWRVVAFIKSPCK